MREKRWGGNGVINMTVYQHLNIMHINIWGDKIVKWKMSDYSSVTHRLQTDINYLNFTQTFKTCGSQQIGRGWTGQNLFKYYVQ